jgi:hypothetical protein
MKDTKIVSEELDTNFMLRYMIAQEEFIVSTDAFS